MQWEFLLSIAINGAESRNGKGKTVRKHRRVWHCQRTQMLHEFIRDSDKHIQWEPLRFESVQWVHIRLRKLTPIYWRNKRASLLLDAKVGEIQTHSYVPLFVCCRFFSLQFMYWVRAARILPSQVKS